MRSAISATETSLSQYSRFASSTVRRSSSFIGPPGCSQRQDSWRYTAWGGMLRAQCVRMKRTPAAALALAMTVGTLPVACADDGTVRETESLPAAELGIVRAGESLSGSPTQPPPDIEARPARIYHVLTDFDWYARGEPVVLEGTSYTMAGDPLR